MRIMVWPVNGGEKKQIHSLVAITHFIKIQAEHAAFQWLRSSFFYFRPSRSLYFRSIFEKYAYEESTRNVARPPRRRERGTLSSSARGTSTATCAILTAAGRFDNYSDANGCERPCIFMRSSTG